MAVIEPKQPIPVEGPSPNPSPSPLRLISGSDYEKFANILTNEVANSLWAANSTDEHRRLQVEASLEAMAGLGPRDEAEGMLIAQMVALHSTALDCLRRAAIEEKREVVSQRSDEEREVPYARWNVHGRTERQSQCLEAWELFSERDDPTRRCKIFDAPWG